MKILVEKVVFFFFTYKSWWCNIILFYYFHYYFIIFLRSSLLDLKISLMPDFLPALTSMEKGKYPWWNIYLFLPAICLSPPPCLAWCSSYQCDPRRTPRFCQRYTNISCVRSSMNMLVICSFVPMYSTLIFFSTTYSRRKWYLIGICSVIECITRFLERLMALVLS